MTSSECQKEGNMALWKKILVGACDLMMNQMESTARSQAMDRRDRGEIKSYHDDERYQRCKEMNDSYKERRNN